MKTAGGVLYITITERRVRMSRKKKRCIIVSALVLAVAAVGSIVAYRKRRG